MEVCNILEDKATDDDMTVQQITFRFFMAHINRSLYPRVRTIYSMYTCDVHAINCKAGL